MSTGPANTDAQVSWFWLVQSGVAAQVEELPVLYLMLWCLLDLQTLNLGLLDV